MGRINAYRAKQQAQTDGQALHKQKRRDSRKENNKVKAQKRDQIAKKMANLTDTQFLYHFLPGLYYPNVITGSTSDTKKNLSFAPTDIKETYLRNMNALYIPIIREFLQGYVVQEGKSLLNGDDLLTYFTDNNYSDTDVATLIAAFGQARALFCQYYMGKMGSNTYGNVNVVDPTINIDWDHLPDYVVEMFFHQDIQSMFLYTSLQRAGRKQKTSLRNAADVIMAEYNSAATLAIYDMLGVLTKIGFTNYTVQTKSSSAFYVQDFDNERVLVDSTKLKDRDTFSGAYIRHEAKLQAYMQEQEVTEIEMKITTPEGLISEGKSGENTGGISIDAEHFTGVGGLLSPLTWADFIHHIARALQAQVGTACQEPIKMMIAGNRIKGLINANAQGDDNYFVGKLFNHVLQYTKEHYKEKLEDLSNIVFETDEKIDAVVEEGFDSFLEALRNEG